MEASYVLESISQKADACKWLDIGLQLATLVATEDYSLQLYSILNRFIIIILYDISFCHYLFIINIVI